LKDSGKSLTTMERVNHMFRQTLLSVLLGFSFSTIQAQVGPQSGGYMRHGIVQNEGTSARVTANDPRPLLQAVTAVAHQYGWAVDFEDPVYTSSFDLVDVTDPRWRAIHPEAKVMVPSGGRFQSDINLLLSKKQNLQKMVDDYHRTASPGRFTIVNEADGRYDVVGVASRNSRGEFQERTPVLETPISMPKGTRSALETIELIAHSVSLSSNTAVVLGYVPLNLLHQSQVDISASKVPARTLLIDVLTGMSNSPETLVWRLLYDPDGKRYYLNIGAVTGEGL
jgi:hypothetical protein